MLTALPPRAPSWLLLLASLWGAGCGPDLEPQPGNGMEGVYELTGPALEWSLPVGAPVRVGFRQRYVGTEEVCEGGIISEEDCDVPTGYFRLDVQSLECESIACTVEPAVDSGPRHPEFLVTALEEGSGVLRATIAGGEDSPREDRWPIDARQPSAIRVSHSPLADAGTHHAIFVGGRLSWQQRLVAIGDDGSEMGLAQTHETIHMELEDSHFIVDDSDVRVLSFEAVTHGTTRVHLRGAGLERMLELTVVDRARVASLEVVRLQPWAIEDASPVDVDVDPLEDPLASPLVLDHPGALPLALRAVMEDGTHALGGAVTLSAMPAGHLFLLQRGADAFFTLERYADGDVVVEAAVGQALLSLDVHVRDSPEPSF